MDLSVFRAKLAVTTQQLAEVGRQAELAEPPKAATLDRLRNVASGVEELIRICDGQELPARRNCPVCAKSVMAAATLCGYCWTRLTPVPAGHS